MAPVEGRNVRTNTMFSAILAALFAIKILASQSQIYRLSFSELYFKKNSLELYFKNPDFSDHDKINFKKLQFYWQF